MFKTVSDLSNFILSLYILLINLNFNVYKLRNQISKTLRLEFLVFFFSTKKAEKKTKSNIKFLKRNNLLICVKNVCKIKKKFFNFFNQ